MKITCILLMSLFLFGCASVKLGDASYFRLGDQKLGIRYTEKDVKGNIIKEFELKQASEAQALSDMAQAMKNLSELAAKASVP